MSLLAPLPKKPLFRTFVLKTMVCGIAVGFLSPATAEEPSAAPAENAAPSKAATSSPIRNEVPVTPAKTDASSPVAAETKAVDASPKAPILSKKAATVAETATRPSTDHELLLTNIIHEFNEAVRSGNFAEANAKLNVLRALLPEKSLTLLRMRAWYAMSSGDSSEAKKLYRQLLSRITDDENAGVNLAILEARDGRMNEALRILSDLSNRGVSSEHLDAVKKAFGQTVSENY